MKKLLSLMLLVTTMLTFTACDDDNDDPAEYYSALLVGSWVFEENADTYIHSVSTVSVFDFYPDRTFCWTFYTVVDGKTVDTSYVDGTYSYNGKILTLFESDGYVESLAASMVVDNVLTIIDNEGRRQTYLT